MAFSDTAGQVDRTLRARAARYRIVAGAAHSWSSMLIEDEHGRRYLYTVGTEALTRIDAAAAAGLLASRAYRPWRGDRSWTPLAKLPIYPTQDDLSAPVSESPSGDASM